MGTPPMFKVICNLSGEPGGSSDFSSGAAGSFF